MEREQQKKMGVVDREVSKWLIKLADTAPLFLILGGVIVGAHSFLTERSVSKLVKPVSITLGGTVGALGLRELLVRRARKKGEDFGQSLF